MVEGLTPPTPVRPRALLLLHRLSSATAAAPSRAVARAAPGARRVAAGAAVGPNELMQLAAPTPVQVNEIFTAAGTMFGVTLFGLAIGFVLLRVEAAVESK